MGAPDGSIARPNLLGLPISARRLLERLLAIETRKVDLVVPVVVEPKFLGLNSGGCTSMNMPRISLERYRCCPRTAGSSFLRQLP